jgi:hypothetical protein
MATYLDSGEPSHKSSSCGLARRALELIGLCAFAITQPLLEVMRQQPDFLVAHNASPLDIAFFLLFLVVVPPLLLVLAEALLDRASPRWGRLFHRLLVAALLVAIFLPPLDRSLSVPGIVVLALATIMGIGLAILLMRLRGLRSLLSWTALSAPIFVTAFLLAPSIRLLAFPEEPQTLGAEVTSRVPVVLVVFDEFTTVALLDEKEEIDATRFPQVANFARDAIWFRNATATSDATTKTIPAILSGKLPAPGQRAALPYHPNNLFTWLESSHEIKAVENVTSLSPQRYRRGGGLEGFGLLISDLFYVYLHRITPDDLAGGLPSVSHHWLGFGDPDGEFDALVARTWLQPVREDFLDSIVPSAKPGLYFVHSALPHERYRYYPTGTSYNVDGAEVLSLGKGWHRWEDDPWVVLQSQQRYLL